jgi:putative ABC transport system permease protein
MIPVRYNLRSLVVRRVGTVMTVLGVGLTVAVFVSILAMVQGLESTFTTTGEALNLVVIRQGAQVESNSFFDREVKPVIETMPGAVSVAGEIIVIVNHPRVTGETTNLLVRGIDATRSFELRPRVKLLEGRMYRPGLREVIVSRSVSRRFRNAAIGDSIRLGRADWTVVGLFDASRTAHESEIWADYGEVAEEFERPIYSSLLVRVTARPDIQPLRERITTDRRFRLDVFTEVEYYEAQTSTAAPLRVLGYLIATIMAVGSCFAVMNTMYAATAYRAREIATLRVLGFRGYSILLSFMIESLVLSLLGGIAGCLLALPIHGISTGTSNFVTFSEVVFEFQVTPRLMLTGLAFAAIMGTLGGFLPARVASRTTITRALRTEV